MQAHSNGLKCSNGIFSVEENLTPYFFSFILIYECFSGTFYLFRQVLSFSILLHPEEEQWRVDTYIML